MKLIFKKGHKSHALRLLGILLGIIATIGIVGYFISSSTEQTSKVSFKAAGLKYKQQLRVESLQDLPIEEKQAPKKHVRKVLKKVLINGTDYFMSLKVNKTTNTSSKRVVKRPVDMMEMSSDLQLLSSFDCVKSIPTILLDYVSNMFVNEYGKSHTDIHFLHRFDEKLPLLKQFSINCDNKYSCSTLFQYDKQYGLKTTADNTYQKKDVFYCCPSVHNTTSETISNICKHAQTVARKSIFRESKASTFLGRVIELATYAIR